MQYLTSHVFLGSLSYTFLTEEVSFTHLLLPIFPPKLPLNPVSNFNCSVCFVSCQWLRLTKLSATGQEDMNNSSSTTAVWPVYSNQVYTILAQQKSLTVRIKRAGTPIYKHAKKEN